MVLVNIDEIMDLFEISDADINARCTIEEALWDGIIQTYEDTTIIVHGHWVEKLDPRYAADRESGLEDAGVSYHCSECGSVGWGVENYCPHCGTRMDGKKSENGNNN